MRHDLTRRGGVKPVTLGVALATVITLAACDWFTPSPPEVEVPGGDPAVGRQLVRDFGCIACHTIPGIRAEETWVGPPLTAWSQRRYIAGRLANEPDNLIAWIQNPQEIDPGNAMPVLGVSEQEARDIAAYLYTIE